MPGSFTKLPERNLDVLRAVAVLCVLADHVAIAATAPGNVSWGWVGRAGVLIFFVHTALVLMGSLERSGGMRPGWISRFYVRRAWRIYPLAVATIVMVLALNIPEHTVHAGYPAPLYHGPDNGTIVSNMLLIQNLVAKGNVNGVLWTLPIEVQMYIALPLCFLIARRSVRAVLLLAFAGMLGAFAWRAELPIPGLWRLSMLVFVPCFMGGVLAYALLRRSPLPRLSAGLTFLAVGVIMAAFFAVRSHYESFAPQWAFCLALGVIISKGREIASSVFSRAAHVIAKYSYGIYLLHLPALWIALVAFGGAPQLVQWLLFAVLMVALPWAAFHLIEHPGIALAQRLLHQRMPQQTPVGAP
jgi:peptidoglycan/LPS O-acetylase OafA/YrhL